jgi:hypothetical protein
MSAVFHDVAETKQLIMEPAGARTTELETKASTPPTATHTPMHHQLSGQSAKPHPPPTYAAYPATHTPDGPTARGPSAKRTLKDRVSSSRGPHPPPRTAPLRVPSRAHTRLLSTANTPCMTSARAPPPSRSDRASHRATPSTSLLRQMATALCCQQPPDDDPNRSGGASLRNLGDFNLGRQLGEVRFGSVGGVGVRVIRGCARDRTAVGGHGAHLAPMRTIT